MRGRLKGGFGIRGPGLNPECRNGISTRPLGLPRYPDGYDSLMPPYKEQGIVLRSHKLGEADKIVTIMTQGSGKVRAVAKGIRKTTSRFGARLEPFTHVNLMLYRGRGALDTVTQAEIIAPHAAIRDDLALFAAGETMLEAVDKVAEEHEKNVRLVLLLLAGLRALDTKPAAPDAVAESFLLKLLSLSGFHPVPHRLRGVRRDRPAAVLGRPGRRRLRSMCRGRRGPRLAGRPRPTSPSSRWPTWSTRARSRCPKPASARSRARCCSGSRSTTSSGG